MKKVILGGLGLLLVAAGALMLVTAASSRAHQRTEERQAETNRKARLAYLKPPSSTEPILSDYTLTAQTGKAFDSKSLAGEVYVVNFFFATCPSVCRMQNGQMAELHRDFADRGVRFVSITCDPAKDTPPALAEYAKLFGARPDRWFFLTGDLTYIKRVGAEIYQVAVDKEVHSERLLAVDRAGKIRGAWHWNKPEEIAAMKSELEKMLAEPKLAVESARSSS